MGVTTVNQLIAKWRGGSCFFFLAKTFLCSFTQSFLQLSQFVSLLWTKYTVHPNRVYILCSPYKVKCAQQKVPHCTQGRTSMSFRNNTKAAFKTRDAHKWRHFTKYATPTNGLNFFYLCHHSFVNHLNVLIINYCHPIIFKVSKLMTSFMNRTRNRERLDDIDFLWKFSTTFNLPFQRRRVQLQ